MAASAHQICEHVARFVAGRISLREFEQWFVPATWDIHKANDPHAERLADLIDLNISEYTDSLLTDAELRAELAAAIRPSEEPPRIYARVYVLEYGRPMARASQSTAYVHRSLRAQA